MSYWPNKESDICEAKKIIEDHQIANAGGRLGLVDIVLDKNKKQVFLSTPAWIYELRCFFYEKYGSKFGQEITEKVITNYLLEPMSIH